jgi:hypothetical protein
MLKINQIREKDYHNILNILKYILKKIERFNQVIK